MPILYKSLRVGKNHAVFYLYKFRTLKENIDKTSSFAKKDQYTWGGRFLRKTKLDELPQLWNVIKRDINIVGPRPEELKTIDLLPLETQNAILSRRPGLTSLASLHFFDESQVLEKTRNVHEVYWTAIKPIKIMLDVFYVQNRDIGLDAWIVWKTIVLVIKSFFK